MEHIESRPSKIENAISHDIYLEIKCSLKTLNRIKSAVKKSVTVAEISVLESIDKRTELLGMVMSHVPYTTPVVFLIV